jgi:hypothetical protein
MRFAMTVLLVLLIVADSTANTFGERQELSARECDVSQPNGRGTLRQQPNPGLHGNGLLSIYLGSPDTTVIFRPNGAGFVTSDGALGMNFGWNRGVRGQLTIQGRRLDGAAPRLRYQIACCGYGDSGLQPSYLIFPTPGCWEVTGQVGNRKDSRLTFVLRVVKIGDGPSARLDP